MEGIIIGVIALCKAALLLIEDKPRAGKEAASENEESIQNFD